VKQLAGGMCEVIGNSRTERVEGLDRPGIDTVVFAHGLGDTAQGWVEAWLIICERQVLVWTEVAIKDGVGSHGC
jgi:hypothetical protein